MRILFDLEDRELVEGSRWCLSNGYPSRRRNNRIEYLHVLIAGELPGLEVDHVNGDKLDVRRSNLRHLTHAENCQNRHELTRNTSGHRGVSFDARRGRWRAYATVGMRRFELGRFGTAEAAAEVARQFRAQHMSAAT